MYGAFLENDFQAVTRLHVSVLDITCTVYIQFVASYFSLLGLLLFAMNIQCIFSKTFSTLFNCRVKGISVCC